MADVEVEPVGVREGGRAMDSFDRQRSVGKRRGRTLEAEKKRLREAPVHVALRETHSADREDLPGGKPNDAAVEQDGVRSLGRHTRRHIAGGSDVADDHRIHG